ncbi:MAG: hypothetical protein AUJ74_00325 [Candidatus Omnitrophica bacterium CG1_02_44_16]|nr:MAG: hypothetical protein AUJ74_00325 [Candidatus Omnitrophica bacterium CG1_02_44_16]PIY83067.1 MAG: hypothetical protein COY78_03765 [Candidatus Omnitrophica bacterium CG_4_10_14_0_8_um_filter_44_12]PIZ83394.1 MAG: hypothetical protein COX96_08185 [Candidatus Omnitrophica bacterium CG_4_10_14_0_2_um_filter_44_9]
MNNNLTIDIMIEPTNRCNFRCPTCFSHQDDRPKTDLKFGVFKKFIDINKHYIGSLSLFNYGEPLLNKDIFRMIAYAKENGISYTKVATNGFFLTQKASKMLLLSGLDHLSVSLDGASEDTYKVFRKGGCFHRVLSNIRSCVYQKKELMSKMKIEAQFIIMKHNESELKHAVKLSKRLGVDIIRLKTLLVKKKAWAKFLPVSEKYSRYSKKPHFLGCRKPLSELVINSDGTVLPCCYIVGLRPIKKYSLGNIRKSSLVDILKTKKYSGFVRQCALYKDAISCCRDCQEGNSKLDHKIIKFNARP